jgi:hypothetical protein
MFSKIFKLASYFFKLADYESFRDKVEQLSKNNPYPFKNWFGPNGRTYIPFGGITPDDEEDAYVISLLKEHGWIVSDYRGGYAQKAGRIMRIGKIFQQIKKETQNAYKKELEDAKNRKADEFEIDNIIIRSEDALKFVNETEAHFINTSTRGKKSGKLSIVISQNPRDVATMSTDRSWGSCMTLGEGSHHSDVFCEVERGGLVAYLIDEEDIDIKEPYARIHIRRFDDKNGNSIALPEKSVYGNDVAGFHQAVEKWINSVQKQITPGIYERQGGKWSDTFQRTHVVAPQVNYDTPEGQNELANWLKGIGLPENAVYMEYKVEDNLYNQIDEEGEPAIRDRNASFLSKEEAEHYIQEQNWLEESQTEREFHWDNEWNEIDEESDDYKYPRFKLVEHEVDNRPELKMGAAQKLMSTKKGVLSQDIINTLKNFLFTEGKYSQLRIDFTKKYPESLSAEESGELSDREQIDFIKSLPEEKRIPYLRDWNRVINQTLQNPTDIFTEERIEQLSKPDPEKSIIAGYSPREGVGIQIEIDFSKYITDPLIELFDQLPEETIQNIIAFSKSLPSYKIENDNKSSKRINERIMHLFAIKRADSPAVQNYYKDQLFRWNQFVRGSKDNSSLIYSLGSLAENGKAFLPFLKEKLEESKTRYQTLKNQRTTGYQLESAKGEVINLLWAIDTIETGRFSTKYKFRH